jgi:hypothetical protein
MKDKYDESSSSGTPSIETLTDSDSEKYNEIAINEFFQVPGRCCSLPRSDREKCSFPHVLTEEQRATAFKWAPPPQSIVPEFI